MTFSEAVHNVTYLDGNGNSKVVGYITEPSQVMIHETLHSMSDVYRFLLRLMNDKIKISNVEMDECSTSECPEINIEYIRYPDLTACTVAPSAISSVCSSDAVDVCCSHDDTLEFIKREMKRQFAEERERVNIKEEPKEEETVFEFKEISW